MPLHQASGRWKLGLTLALVTAACWATLPVALKLTLQQLDPYTLTWFRFLLAAGVMLAWLAARDGLGGFASLDGRRWGLLLAAALCLIGNYVFYLLGVQWTSPANAQLLIQLAPLLMALGGIFVFRERFNGWQWAGLAILFGGLALFFREQLGVGGRGYAFGSGLVVFAAVVWAAYALLQKQLLLRLSSPAILLAIYLCASVVLLPLARPAALLQLDGLHWGLLMFCAVNTLVAYGAFAEALAHWEASRVSAILATTPLLCVAAVAGVHTLWPASIAPERIGWLGYAGAALVVLGSALTSLMGSKR
ncbi:DMT family transporter [Arenimonas terrae]|uniref:DMT family transporter n=1 Tax=Arenimonas terrae TaxID=2546226 RepID=UPI00159ECCA1|nr:DMT family transporter [Arenimonas terrae]